MAVTSAADAKSCKAQPGYGAELAPGERAMADYAASRIATRGRVFQELPCLTRSHVQRDRDRILHATAFRRLIHKTQVFLFHEGDHYRTRLTHSLEVAQIARTIARQLRLDEDLAEALALAHDLGHPPFGHAGERALDGLMTACGGFDHNLQSFRIVTGLERKYAHFDGLNLCWETLEGLIKHNGPPAAIGRDGQPINPTLVHALRRFNAQLDLELDRYASAEAQVAALADDIAWMTHDIDDGQRAGLIGPADLEEVPLTRAALQGLPGRLLDDDARRIYEVVRRLITELIADAVTFSRARFAAVAPRSAEHIRRLDAPIIGFSTAMAEELARLRGFLFARLYRHPRVIRIMDDAQNLIRDLVARYLRNPLDMPPEWAKATQAVDQRRRARLVADFVAGMTDRYAMGEHRRLFDATPELR